MENKLAGFMFNIDKMNLDNLVSYIKIANQKGIKIILSFKYKRRFNEYLLKHINTFKGLNIDIFGPLQKEAVPLNKYIIYEEYLASIVDKYRELSPVETFLSLYNFVKHFKKYRNNDANMDEASDLYKILTNEYINCEGYVNLLTDLVRKAGIEISPYFCHIYEGDEARMHAKARVHLVDSKYGIDGYFTSDPTFDARKGDYYVHALLTNDQERRYVKKETYFDTDVGDMFYASSSNELDVKLRFFKDVLKEENLFKFMLDFLEEFDKDLYLKIKNLSFTDSIDILLGRILEKNDNQISFNTLMDIVSFLYDRNSLDPICFDVMKETNQYNFSSLFIKEDPGFTY